MRRRFLGPALLALACACSGPSVAGRVRADTYTAPSGEWSIAFPFEPSICVLSDEQFPDQENAAFAPKVPLGFGLYQIAVTYRTPAADQTGAIVEDAWFEALVQRMERAHGGRARLLGSERFPAEDGAAESGAECWARAYAVRPSPVVDGGTPTLHLFLLRPLPPREQDGVRGAALFGLVLPQDVGRSRLGEDPPLDLPAASGWASLSAWSETLVLR